MLQRIFKILINVIVCLFLNNTPLLAYVTTNAELNEIYSEVYKKTGYATEYKHYKVMLVDDARETVSVLFNEEVISFGSQFVKSRVDDKEQLYFILLHEIGHVYNHRDSDLYNRIRHTLINKIDGGCWDEDYAAEYVADIFAIYTMRKELNLKANSVEKLFINFIRNGDGNDGLKRPNLKNRLKCIKNFNASYNNYKFN